MRLVTAPVNQFPRYLRWAGFAVVGLFALIGVGTVLNAPAPPPAASPAPTAAIATAVTSADPSVPIASPVATPNPASSKPTDDASTADAQPEFMTLKSQSKAQLEARLDGLQGVSYSGVSTHITPMDTGVVVAFCGSLTFDMPDGNRSVPERFVASRSTAVTEADMTQSDFGSAWIMFCGGQEGPSVWR